MYFSQLKQNVVSQSAPVPEHKQPAKVLEPKPEELAKQNTVPIRKLDHYLGDMTEIDPKEEPADFRFSAPDYSEVFDPMGLYLDKTPKAPEPLRDYKNAATIPEPQYPKISPVLEFKGGDFDFRIYSHNIKTGINGKRFQGELPWRERVQAVGASIRLHASPNTVVLLQEALRFQMDDVLNFLNLRSTTQQPEWTAFGVGREDGREEGEHVPIFVRTAEWDILYTDTFWLSDLPRKPLIGWDAKYPRICTYATLRNKATGYHINVFNSHWDHLGKNARLNSASMLVNKALLLKKDQKNDWPSFFAGDYNAGSGDDCVKKMAETYKDLHEVVQGVDKIGHPDITLTGFLGYMVTALKRIDYIFGPPELASSVGEVCEKDTLATRVMGFGYLHSKFGGQYMSDHRPVMGMFRLAKCEKPAPAANAQA